MRVAGETTGMPSRARKPITCIRRSAAVNSSCRPDKMESPLIISTPLEVSPEISRAATLVSNEGRRPLVSVVIPAYNVAPYIGETLESVFAQTFADYEAIVLNDGSPDTEDFEQAIAPYLNRILYLKQENVGASVARNTGLRAARGEFIAFLDADDLWLPAYLDQQMKFIRERGCDLACADATFFGDPSSEGKTYMDT